MLLGTTKAQLTNVHKRLGVRAKKMKHARPFSQASYAANLARMSPNALRVHIAGMVDGD